MPIVNYFQKALSLFRNGNRFLVVEILNHQVKVTLVKVDFNKRTLCFVKALSVPLAEDHRQIINSLKGLLAKFGKLFNHQIVLLLASRFATSLHTSVSLVRNRPKEPIDEGDLDNLISRAIWGFFDRQRARVADKMGISDLDVILSDVQVWRVKLDGHKVVNPIGFQAKSVEIQLNLTFTARDFINEIKKLLPKENIVFVNEDGAAWAHLLARAHNLPSFLVANIFPEQTTLFSAEENSLAYLDSFDWGEVNLKNVIARHFEVNQETAARILSRYTQNDASAVFVRRMENFLLDGLHLLAKGLERALKKAETGHIYLHSFFPLPPAVFSSSFRNKLGQSARLLPVNDNLVGEKFNLELKLKKGRKFDNVLATLAGILIFSLSSQNAKINRIAKRRIRWLI